MLTLRVPAGQQDTSSDAHRISRCGSGPSHSPTRSATSSVATVESSATLDRSPSVHIGPGCAVRHDRTVALTSRNPLAGIINQRSKADRSAPNTCWSSARMTGRSFVPYRPRPLDWCNRPKIANAGGNFASHGESEPFIERMPVRVA